MSDAKYWIGLPPTVCDICNEPLRGEFIDGKTRMGPWANMCVICFRQVGLGLGMGRGQQYARQEDGRYLKTAG